MKPRCKEEGLRHTLLNLEHANMLTSCMVVRTSGNRYKGSLDRRKLQVWTNSDWQQHRSSVKLNMFTLFSRILFQTFGTFYDTITLEKTEILP